MKCKRDSDGRVIDHHSLPDMRQQASKAVRNGQSETEIGRAFGINIRTFFRCLADFGNGEQNAVLPKPAPGRPPRLGPDQLRWPAKAFRDNMPLQFKFESGLWRALLLVKLIRRELLRQKLALASVNRVTRLLGVTLQDPVVVQQWQSEACSAIRAQAQATGVTIFFADESGIRSDSHIGPSWGPQGQAPLVDVTGRRFSLNLISAIGPRDEFRFMLHEGSVIAHVFREFLKHLMIVHMAPVVVDVDVDEHPIHKAKSTRTMYKASTAV